MFYKTLLGVYREEGRNRITENGYVHLYAEGVRPGMSVEVYELRDGAWVSVSCIVGTNCVAVPQSTSGTGVLAVYLA